MQHTAFCEAAQISNAVREVEEGAVAAAEVGDEAARDGQQILALPQRLLGPQEGPPDVRGERRCEREDVRREREGRREGGKIWEAYRVVAISVGMATSYTRAVVTVIVAEPEPACE
jgi:hypothetical protein